MLNIIIAAGCGATIGWLWGYDRGFKDTSKIYQEEVSFWKTRYQDSEERVNRFVKRFMELRHET
jgi:hypothetical protein